MVLAACSPYFQNLFTDLPCKHPVVVLKDVRYSDIKAILEYMYRGEVNVGQNQLADLLRVAEALKVKGLVEEKRGSESSDVARTDSNHPSPTGVSTSSTSNNQSTVHSSSAESPPHSTNGFVGGYKTNPYMYPGTNKKSTTPSMESQSSPSPRMNIPMWPVGGLPIHPSHSPSEHPSSNAAAAQAVAMLSSCYQAGSTDMNPLKRKKLSSLLMSRDTPILRTVLGQADSSQPVSLVCHPDESPNNVNSNGVEELPEKHIKNEPSEGAQSPFTDISMEYDEKSKMGMNSPYASGMSGIATYVPSNVKPEWKRYKQYTRNDIMSAIDAVRNGMSALQAARKYGVPSRTLYDKVKKLGITTSRPFKRGTNGSSLGFPYGISGTSSPFGMDSDEHSINNNSSLLEASSILQHALDARDDKEALAAMIAAHAAMSGRNTSPNNNSSARTTSPPPNHLKYMSRMNSLPPSPVVGSDPNHSETNGSGSSDREHDHEHEHDDHDHDHDQDENDHVEDLSVGRKQVIMPPINMSSIIKKEEMLKETLMEEMRREVAVSGDNTE